MLNIADNQCACSPGIWGTKNPRAFTLVELLIVVVILGILATVVIPVLSSAAHDAKLNTLQGQLKVVREAMQRYNLDHFDVSGQTIEEGISVGIPGLTEQTYPSGCFELPGTLCANPSGASPLGPYLQAFPKNPFASQNVDHVLWDRRVVFGELGWAVGYKYQGEKTFFRAASFRSAWDAETMQY